MIGGVPSHGDKKLSTKLGLRLFAVGQLLIPLKYSTDACHISIRATLFSREGLLNRET
jgi:hypothetical protein